MESQYLKDILQNFAKAQSLQFLRSMFVGQIEKTPAVGDIFNNSIELFRQQQKVFSSLCPMLSKKEIEMAAVITTIFAQEAALKKQQIPDCFFDALYLSLKIKEKEAIASINNQLEKTLEEN